MSRLYRFTILLAALVLSLQSTQAAAPSNYYDRAIGKHDEALMTALRDIIREHKEVSYSSGLLNAFAIADVDDQGYIIDIYSNCRYRPNDNGSSASHVGEGYNREHSFPRSWFGGKVSPMNTDVFHIYPTDIRVNGQRGNNPYGMCAGGTRLSYGNYVAKGKLGNSTYPGYSGIVFEPDDEYKGDLARTYFYMATCYKKELPNWPGSAQLDYATNKYKAFSTWTITMLMEWARLDPVSEKEIKRNDAVFGIQGNRNPFIDHPELAEYIWGDKQGINWRGGDIEPTPAIVAPQDGLTFNMGKTTVGTPLVYKVYLKGEALTQELTLTMSDNSNFLVDAVSFDASDINSGKMLTITFTAENEGSFRNDITLGSSEASVTFHVIAESEQIPGPNPDPVMGDSIMEDWEGCETGGYWNGTVEGNAFSWQFDNAGIWDTETLKHGEYSCRLGKSSNSSITMAEDYDRGTNAISFWAGSFGNDNDATLNVDYSTDKGSTWTNIGSVTTTKGSLQHFSLTSVVKVPVRYRIVQTSGVRVNIDDITLYAFVLKGDVNDDKEVNIMDIDAIINIILGSSPDESTFKRADVNNDEEINILDVDAVLGIILGI